ncbi:uncharacterized protein [Argopecten irradians]|uniref:uncharacterized protein n=1 Tax=Argopecten irradians TaxID=31199 RepID=UPI00371A172C
MKDYHLGFLKHPLGMWILMSLLLPGIPPSVYGLVRDDRWTPSGTIWKMCHEKVTKNTNLSCDYSSIKTNWNSKFFEEQTCKLEIATKSRRHFQRKYTHLQFNFAKLILNFRKDEKAFPVTSNRCVIQPVTWIWTHTGQQGYQALYWPHEYPILSLGTLERKLYGPYCVRINMKGNCSSFVIGEMNTTLLIVRTLTHLIPNQTNIQFPTGMGDKHVWCYTKMTNMTKALRLLCQYTICPEHTVGYSCCKYNTHCGSLSCDGEPYQYKEVWWEVPYIIGSVVYLFFPILIIVMSNSIYGALKKQASMSYAPNDQEDFDWISENHVCFSSVLFSPFRCFVVQHPVAVSRLVRFLISLLPVSITAIYLILAWKDYSLRLFLTDLAANHVTIDVSSMLAGFELSRQNFLTIFGGPYIAFSLCLILFAALLSVPKSLAILLESGLPDPSPEQLSPLCVDMATKSTLGTTHSLGTSIGYEKIYRTFLVQIKMIFNPEYWKFVLKYQTGRWTRLTERLPMCRMRALLVYFILIPLFATMCVIEWITCLLYYGIPIVFINAIVFRAYCTKMRRCFPNTSGRMQKCISFLFIFMIATVLLFCSYILHILFVHSFIFLASTAIFTYTGFIAYPEHYRNYLICYLSVAVYVVESIRSMKLTYDELFDKTKLVCDIMTEGVTYRDFELIKKTESNVCIPQRLFNFVVSHHKPLRIETFLIFYKLVITIMVIYMSVVMLLIFDTFDHMNVLTEIGTTVVICMAPKVLRRVFKCSGYRSEVEERQGIKLWVTDYLREMTSSQGVDRSVSLSVL